MTRKTATCGQSLLISGALKMARSKRAVSSSNPNYYHPKLTTRESHTRQLRAAIENHHLLAAGSAGHHHQVVDPNEPNSTQPQQRVRDSDSDSPTNSMSGSSSPISPSLQDFSSPQAPGQVSDQQQHGDDQHNKHQAASGKNKKLFPQKLWDLINDERYSFCLRWSDDGQLVYLNRDEFEDSYLKTTENQFHTQKAISFVRQMNMYGFRKVDDCFYENDNFKRGCEHLLKNMTRKHPNKLTSSNASNPTAVAHLTNALVAANEVDTPAELPHFLYHKSMSGEHQQESILANIISSSNNNNEHHQNQPLNLHRSQFIDQIQHLQNLQQQQRQQQQQQNQQQQQLQQQQSQVVDCTIQWLTILAAISYNLNMHVDNS